MSDEEREVAGYSMPLPMPPGLNNRMFCMGRRMVLAKKYREWKSAAVREIMDTFEHFDADYLPSDARYRVTMFFSFKDKRRRDIDGFAKPVLDAITESGVAWDDDHQVDELMLYRAEVGRDEVLVFFESLKEGNRE